MLVLVYYMENQLRGCCKSIPLSGTPSSVFIETYDQKTIENQTYYPWIFITYLDVVFTMTYC